MSIITTILALLVFGIIIGIQYFAIRYKSNSIILLATLGIALLAIVLLGNPEAITEENMLTTLTVTGFAIGMVLFILCDNVVTTNQQDILFIIDNGIVLAIYLSTWINLGSNLALESWIYLITGHLAAYILIIVPIYTIKKLGSKSNPTKA